MRHATTITSILLRPRLLTCPRLHSGQKGAAVAGVNNCPERELKARQVDPDDLLLLIDYSMPLSPDEKECIRLGQKVCGAPSPPPLTLTMTPTLTISPCAARGRGVRVRVRGRVTLTPTLTLTLTLTLALTLNPKP